MAKKKQIQEVSLSIMDCVIISRMDDAESILGLQPPFEPSNTNRKIEEFLANAPFVQDEEELDGQAAAFGSFWGCLSPRITCQAGLAFFIWLQTMICGKRSSKVQDFPPRATEFSRPSNTRYNQPGGRIYDTRASTQRDFVAYTERATEERTSDLR